MINYTEENKKRENSRNNAIVTGVIIIIIGCIFALYNMEIIPWEVKSFIISWQMLLIAIGIISISRGNGKTSGWIMISIGVFFIIPRLLRLIPSLSMLEIDFAHKFWPAILILVGLIIIISGSKRSLRIFPNEHTECSHNTKESFPKDGPDYINYDHIFSGGKHSIYNNNLKGGNINIAFGGALLDLRNSTLSNDPVPVINIIVVFGGINILAPEDWKIEVNKRSIFGGFEDNRYVKLSNDPNKRLIINVNSIFGGGNIKSM